MKTKKREFKLFSEFLRLGTIMVIYYLLGNTQKISDYFIMFLGVFAVAVITNFMYVFYRPITVNAIMTNQITHKHSVDLVENNGRIRQREATVRANIEILSSKGVWNKFAPLIIRKKKVYLEIGAVPIHNKECFTFQPLAIISNVNYEYTSITIDITDIILNDIASNSDNTFYLDFCINLNRDKYPSISEGFEITSKIIYPSLASRIFIYLEKNNDGNKYRVDYWREREDGEER